MATAAPVIEPASEIDKKYVMRNTVEIFPLDSSSTESQYVVKTGGKSYVVSQRLKNILQLFDGTRTVGDVARTLSVREGAKVTDDQMQEIISRFVKGYGLIQEVGGTDDDASRERLAAQQRKASFEFVYRRPILSPAAIEPIVSRLTWLFNPKVAIVGSAAILFVQLAFFLQWFARIPRIEFGAEDLVVYYLLAMSTAFFHEFGHATACRKYKCKYGSIGFLIYLVLPAFYVNLTNAWRLPGRQRAVIDSGGMYFQLLTTVPLYLVFLTTGDPHCAAVIFAVDWMVVFSLNPIFKFDGYWLLVDMSGLINLHQRGWRVVKETVLWAVGGVKRVPALDEVQGKGKKLLLVIYSFFMLAMFSTLLVLLVLFTPSRIAGLNAALHELIASPAKSPAAVLVSAGKLLFNMVFFFFIYRLLSRSVFKVFKRSTWRQTS